MSLKDYKSDNFDLAPDTDDMGDEKSVFRNEITTLKIDKLSNRVTIISIIIPCIIGAILFFAYMDMKEKVTDVDTSKQDQVDRIAKQFDTKLNALDVKIAKNRFDFDKEIPEIKNMLTQIEGILTRTRTEKADKKETMDKLAALSGQIKANTDLIKSAAAGMEKSVKDRLAAHLAAIDKQNQSLEKKIQQVHDNLSKELARLSEIADSLALVKKQVSIVDIRQKDLEKKFQNIGDLDRKIEETKALLLKNLQVIENKFEKEIKVLDHKILSNTIKIQKPLIQSSDAEPESTPPVNPAPDPATDPAVSTPEAIVEESLAE